MVENVPVRRGRRLKRPVRRKRPATFFDDAISLGNKSIAAGKKRAMRTYVA